MSRNNLSNKTTLISDHMQKEKCLEPKISNAISVPSVDVVIVNYNGKNFLEKCLPTILDQNYKRFKVVLVDNGSQDDSVRFVRMNYPKVHIVDLRSNRGFAAGNNVAMQVSDSDYVIALNNDTEVQPNFVQVLVEAAEADPNVASVGCKIVQTSDGTIQYGPVFIDRRHFIYKSPYLTNLLADSRQYEKRSEVAANCACAALYRTSVLRKVGYFDEKFFSNIEDHDLGYRLNLAGYKCVYTPQTTVFHVGGASDGSLLNPPSRRVRLIVRNQLYCFFKNYEPRNLLKVLPTAAVSLCCWTILLWYRNLSSSPNPLRLLSGFFQGLVDFLRVLPDAWSSRKMIQSLRSISDKQIFERTSIHNFDFYPLNKRKKKVFVVE